MTRPVSSIRNLGPASDKAFAKVGINSAEDLEALGTDAAYTKLLEGGARPHFIMYYVIEMGLQGRPWNDCKGKEKEALRKRFDAIKARTTVSPASAIEKELDALGVIPSEK